MNRPRSNNYIAWQVELAILPGKLAVFKSLTAEMIEVARREPGTLVYDRYLSADEATAYVVERYIDSAAAVVHLQAFIEDFSARLSEQIVRKRFLVFGEPNDELRALLDLFGAVYASRLDGFTR